MGYAAQDMSPEPTVSLKDMIEEHVGNVDVRPSLLVIGQGPTGIEVALALAESGKCSVCLGDDAPANADWRMAASCVLQGYRWNGPIAAAAGATPAARGAARKAVTRSQYMAALLTPLSKQSVRAISPVGAASIVERFQVVVMTDPALPHAIAFNEHVSVTRHTAQQYSSTVPKNIEKAIQPSDSLGSLSRN